MRKATLFSPILSVFLCLVLLTPVNGPKVYAAGVDDFRDVAKEYWGRTFIRKTRDQRDQQETGSDTNQKSRPP